MLFISLALSNPHIWRELIRQASYRSTVLSNSHKDFIAQETHNNMSGP